MRHSRSGISRSEPARSAISKSACCNRSDFSSDSAFSYRNIDDLTELNRGSYEELRLSEGLGLPIFRVFRLTFTLEGVNRTFTSQAIPELLASIIFGVWTCWAALLMWKGVDFRGDLT